MARPAPRHLARAAAVAAAGLLAACASAHPAPTHSPSSADVANARRVAERLAADYDADHGVRRQELEEAYPRLRAELVAANQRGTAKKLGGVADQLGREMEGPER